MKTKAILNICEPDGEYYRATVEDQRYSVCTYTLHEYFPRFVGVKSIRATLQSDEPLNKRGWFSITALMRSDFDGRCIWACITKDKPFIPIQQLGFDLAKHQTLWCRLVAVRPLPVENKETP